MRILPSIRLLILLASVTLAGCVAESVTATFAGREADASAAWANLIYVRSESNQAIFQIDDAVVTVTQTQVLWGSNRITPPVDWKRVQLVVNRAKPLRSRLTAGRSGSSLHLLNQQAQETSV